MSKRILKALMQLFAIIAPPDGNVRDKASVVRLFLSQQLNNELLVEYIALFNKYYELNQKKQLKKSKLKKHTSSSSVRVLKICTEINEELTHQQKFVVLVLLLEFIKADNEITPQELEFVGTVAETLYFIRAEFDTIKSFVLNELSSIAPSENLLIIDGYRDNISNAKKHISVDALCGYINIMYFPSSSMYLLRKFGDNELYLNGQIIRQSRVYVLNTGAAIKNSLIKPIYYSDIISVFNQDKINSKILFEVNNIHYHFVNGTEGLHDLSFSEYSGKLVGIMGASGTGKTTLLNVLNGSEKPSFGEVHINEINIHSFPQKIKGLIGHVSQDDLLIEELSVFQNLFFNAQLCFGNQSEKEIGKKVNKMLQQLGLFEIRDMKVGNVLDKRISGGQRKRLNIALELIREPTILFLDEPTSGLSSRDSENIMDLLKELTFKGKLVFVVIHQPSSNIFKMFDRLLILDQGGYLIYNGNPVDSIIYFKSRIHKADWSESECTYCGNINAEQIFNIIESQVLDELGNQTYTRKTAPKEWHQYYKKFTDEDVKNISPQLKLPHASFKIPSKLKQFWIFIQRDVFAKLANRQYVFLNILEAPALAFLLAYIVKFYDVTVQQEYQLINNSNLPVYIFISVVVAIFVGLTVSAQEIYKDQKILKREKFLHLSRNSYLLSKIAVLFILSAIQSLLFVLVGNTIMEIEGMFGAYWLILFSTWLFSNILGLNISDGFKTSVTIYIIIPFLIIPQIILSGVIVPFNKLNPSISKPNSIPWYGEIMVSRWAYEAIAVYQYKDNKFEKNIYQQTKEASNAKYYKNYWLPKLNNILNYCKLNLDKPNYKDVTTQKLRILRNEIGKMNNLLPQFTYEHIEDFSMETINTEQLNQISKHFDKLDKYLTQKFNTITKHNDVYINRLQDSLGGKNRYIELMRKHANQQLSNFVRNQNSELKIIEYDGELLQRSDPIYTDANHKLLKAHFYAPRKRLFNYFIDTIWINVGVIWLMITILYFALYFRVFRKTIDIFSKHNSKRKPTNNYN